MTSILKEEEIEAEVEGKHNGRDWGGVSIS